MASTGGADRAGERVVFGLGDQVGGNGNPVKDPKLGALSNNGGPTDTIARIMAERMTASWTTAPHFYLTVEIEMTRAVEARARSSARGHPEDRPGLGADRRPGG